MMFLKWNCKKWYLLFIILMHPWNECFAEKWWKFTAPETKEQKVLTVNLYGAAAIAVWGIITWGYRTESPHLGKDKWFSEDSKHGGADKFGHFYVNYVLSHGLAHLYEHWGYDRNRAGQLGFWSGVGLLGLVEVGDSVSGFGFSTKDLVMDILGSFAAYVTYRDQALDQLIDIRVEYIPTFTKADVFTDYEGMKYLLAIKLDGIQGISNKYLNYLELHTGFYARGYEDNDRNRQRNLYVALGLNMGKIFHKASYKTVSGVLKYFQFPYTYVEASRDLND